MTPTHKDIIQFVKSRVGDGDSGTFDRLYEDPEAWTSFERIEAALAVEEEFGLQFSSEELAKLRSPKDVVVAVEAALGITLKGDGA